MKKNKLVCKICKYEAKQLHQHLRSVHNLSALEYRNIYGKDEIMQIGWGVPKKVDKILSKKGIWVYKHIFQKLDLIDEIYTLKQLQKILRLNNLWKKYIGKAKNRTLLNDDIKLYKSIYEITKIDELKFGKKMSLPNKIKFILEYDCDIEKLKCSCGKTYTFNRYCRHCPDYHSTCKAHSKKTIKKIRLSTIKYIKSSTGQCAPRYNKTSIPIIEAYGKENGYNFQHAENGGEFHIKELGYWVDGYDKEKNIVLEIDEPHHFDKNGSLRKKDMMRQNEIEKQLNCKFIRIKL
jgi:hypothetical protein